MPFEGYCRRQITGYLMESPPSPFDKLRVRKLRKILMLSLSKHEEPHTKTEGAPHSQGAPSAEELNPMAGMSAFG
jgi:hypothetical protein